MKLSIDPGLNATGICVWRNGIPVELKTIRPPMAMKDPFDKIDYICGSLETLVALLVQDYDETIDMAVVEDFIKFVPKAKISSLAKLFRLQGALLELLRTNEYVQAWGRQSKGTAPKSQANLLAKQYHLKGSQDARDALHIGVCAGFHK